MVTTFNLASKQKDHYAEVAKIYGNNRLSSIHDIVKKKK